MAVVDLGKCLIILMILYVFGICFSLMASIPMIIHVYPRSECLLFSSQQGNSLSYGHYASEFSQEDTIIITLRSNTRCPCTVA